MVAVLCIQQLTGLIPTEFSSFFRWLSVFVHRPGRLFSSPSSFSSFSIFLLLILFNLQVYLDRSGFKHSGSVFPHTWRNFQYTESQLFCSGKNSWIVISKSILFHQSAFSSSVIGMLDLHCPASIYHGLCVPFQLIFVVLTGFAPLFNIPYYVFRRFRMDNLWFCLYFWDDFVFSLECLSYMS